MRRSRSPRLVVESRLVEAFGISSLLLKFLIQISTPRIYLLDNGKTTAGAGMM